MRMGLQAANPVVVVLTRTLTEENVKLAKGSALSQSNKAGTRRTARASLRKKTLTDLIYPLF